MEKRPLIAGTDPMRKSVYGEAYQPARDADTAEAAGSVIYLPDLERSWMMA